MVPSLKPPKEKEHTENSSVKPNSYYYVVFPFCSYIIYFLCFLFFSFKGSSANAEAPRDQREVAKEALSLKNHERFFSSIWIFPFIVYVDCCFSFSFFYIQTSRVQEPGKLFLHGMANKRLAPRILCPTETRRTRLTCEWI